MNIQNAPAASQHRPLIIIDTLLLLIFVLTILPIRRSLAVGELSTPIGYDDVVYLLQSAILNNTIAKQPILDSVQDILTQHAMFPTLLGCIGFIITPNDPVGPYTANIVIVATLFFGCAALLRGLPAGMVTGALAAIGSIPLAFFIVTEMRPDFGWGIFTALAIVGFVSTNIFACRLRVLVGLGLLSGIALISKPSAVPVTAFMMLVGHGGGAVVRFLDTRGSTLPRSKISTAAIFVFCVLAVAGPVYALTGSTVYLYIVTALITLNDQNAVLGDWLFQWTYYSTGPAGELVFGIYFYAIALVTAASVLAIALLDRRRLPRALVLLVTLVVAYVIPSQTVVKTVFLGSAFYFFFLISATYLLGQAVQAGISRHSTWRFWPLVDKLTALAGIAWFLAAIGFGSPHGLVELPDPLRADITNGSKTILSLIENDDKGRGQTVPAQAPRYVLVIDPFPITADWISLYSKMNDAGLSGIAGYYVDSVAELAKRIAASTYVVVGPSSEGALHGPHLGDALTLAMDQNTAFHLIGSYTRPGGQVVRVYARNS